MNYIIRNASRQDIDQLKMLWQEVFSDTMADIDLFFETAYLPEYTLVEADGKRIRGVLYSMDCRLSDKKGRYFYALATALPDRRQGVMGRLLKAAVEKARKDGCDFVWLQPAEEKLFAYYEKNGFDRWLTRRADEPENLLFEEPGRRYLEIQKPEAEDYDALPPAALCRFLGESVVSFISGKYPI